MFVHIGFCSPLSGQEVLIPPDRLYDSENLRAAPGDWRDNINTIVAASLARYSSNTQVTDRIRSIISTLQMYLLPSSAYWTKQTLLESGDPLMKIFGKHQSGTIRVSHIYILMDDSDLQKHPKWNNDGNLFQPKKISSPPSPPTSDSVEYFLSHWQY